MPFAGAHAKEALNFQLTLLIGFVAGLVFTWVTCGIGIFALIALLIYSVIMSIIATMRASEGQQYQYPATIRFVK
jgi:uncharacterized Tic20 family protein